VEKKGTGRLLDTVALPDHSTWYVMSRYPDITSREVGNFYGLRTWVEYGLKKVKMS